MSLIGTWLQSVAQQWLVYRLTGSGFLLGFVGLAGQLPIFFLAPAGGAVADRVDRRRILVATQSAMMLLAFVLGALTLAGVVTVWEVFALAAALGVVNGFDVPSRQAFVVEMVEREDLANAIALNSSVLNGARIVGPAIAGVLVALVGEGWCFVLNGVSFVAVIAGLLAMHVDRRAAASVRASFHDIEEGFRFVVSTRPIRALLLLVGTTSLFGVPYLVLMPIFADRAFHAGSPGLGLLMGANGAGALSAALLLALRGSARGLGSWVTAAAAGFGVSLAIFAVSARFGHLALSTVLLVPVGFCMVTVMAAGNTLMQTLAPDALRGRVMSAWSMTYFGAAPIGAVLAGAAADRIGATTTVVAGGCVCCLAAALFASQLPRWREQARAVITAQQGDGSLAPPRTLPNADGGGAE